MGAAVAMGNASSADRALYTASRQGDADKMRQALKDGANPNFVAEPHGWTPLHVSAAYNKKDGCRVLLTAGSDWSVKDKAGNTPAELAKEKKIEIWRFLDDVANGRTDAEYKDDKFEAASTRAGTPTSQQQQGDEATPAGLNSLQEDIVEHGMTEEQSRLEENGEDLAAEDVVEPDSDEPAAEEEADTDGVAEEAAAEEEPETAAEEEADAEPQEEAAAEEEADAEESAPAEEEA